MCSVCLYLFHKAEWLPFSFWGGGRLAAPFCHLVGGGWERGVLSRGPRSNTVVSPSAWLLPTGQGHFPQKGTAQAHQGKAASIGKLPLWIHPHPLHPKSSPSLRYERGENVTIGQHHLLCLKTVDSLPVWFNNHSFVSLNVLCRMFGLLSLWVLLLLGLSMLIS